MDCFKFHCYYCVQFPCKLLSFNKGETQWLDTSFNRMDRESASTYSFIFYFSFINSFI